MPVPAHVPALILEALAKGPKTRRQIHSYLRGRASEVRITFHTAAMATSGVLLALEGERTDPLGRGRPPILFKINPNPPPEATV